MVYIVGIDGFFHPQESLEKTINTMGTLSGVHPSLSLQNTFCPMIIEVEHAWRIIPASK